MQPEGDNQPLMNASFPAGNDAGDARDNARKTRQFQCGEALWAALSFTIIYCDEMLVHVARVVSRTAAPKHWRHAVVCFHPRHHIAHLLRCCERGAQRPLGRC